MGLYDIIGEDLLWQVVKERAKEKVDERVAVAWYNVSSVDRQWVDTEEAFEGEPMRIRSRIVVRGFNSAVGPDFHAEGSGSCRTHC